MNNRKAFARILVLSVASLVAGAVSESVAQSREGIDLYNSWQYPQAEKVFREEVKANANNTPASFYLGLSVLHQEKYREALDIFLKVDESRQRTRSAVPSEFQIQLAMAQARIGLKQYSEAWKNLESARMADGSASDVYVYRGLYYLEQDKTKEAEKELGKAISLDAKNPYAYYYSGLAHYKAGHPQEAVEDLKMFLQLAPDAPEAPKAKLLHDQLC